MAIENITYEHGYKFIDTFGNKDFGEIYINMIIRDIRSDIDSWNLPEYNNKTNISCKGTNYAKNKQKG